MHTVAKTFEIFLISKFLIFLESCEEEELTIYLKSRRQDLLAIEEAAVILEVINFKSNQ